MARRLLALAAALILPCVNALAQPQIGLQSDVIFSDEAPLAGNTELLRRFYSPLAAAEIRRSLAGSRSALGEQSIDLAQERFVVYVPARPPPQGYALLVFVPPWEDAALPKGWAAVLDHYGMIFVSAARSGNDESPPARREPLALIAAYNIMRRYQVDPQRVYIGGFSGGSRIAMRLALGYPDVFRGALLNAGSDAIGLSPTLPPQDLFLEFQSSSRLVYLTGEKDALHLDMDGESRHSMREWCVFDVEAEVTPGAGHAVADSQALARALPVLLKHSPPDPEKLAACRAGLANELAAKLQQVEALIARGQRDEAKKMLIKIDTRFGGLAAPRSIELNTRLASAR